MNFGDVGETTRKWTAVPIRFASRSASLACALGLTLLTGCGGGGSAPPQTAVIGVTSASVSTSAAGPTLLAFRAALINGAAYPIQLSFSTSGLNLGASCDAGVDYIVPAASGLRFTVLSGSSGNGTLTLASSAASRQINLTACAGNSAADRLLTFKWSNGLNSGVAVGTLRGNLNTSLSNSIHLNDTAITACATGSNNALSCPQAGFDGQDAQTGRDATAAITGQGDALSTAFLFTPLAAGACIQDNVTGLTWEAKTGSGEHNASSTFSWFSSAVMNGGSSGSSGGGSCSGVSAGCDTEKFTAQVNAEALCGFSDWRLPNAQELAGIIDNGASAAPVINAVFAHQSASAYWTASPKAVDPSSAWNVDFSSGAVGFDAKSAAHSVQLVRGQ